MGKSITELKLTPSAKLAAVVGAGKITRPQAVKKVWAYIKASWLSYRADNHRRNQGRDRS